MPSKRLVTTLLGLDFPADRLTSAHLVPVDGRSWEANGYAGQMLWRVFWEMPQNIKEDGIGNAVFYWNRENWVIAGIIASIGGAFGIFRMSRREQERASHD
jgi:hypothetical protein